MKYFIIFNPGSRSGKSCKNKIRLLELLKNFKIDFKMAETKNLTDAYDLSLQANKSGFNVITAVGGDGTINQVLNGFYNNNGKRISEAKLSVIHTGTSPDFCKSYNIPLDFESAFVAMTGSCSRKIRIGIIKYFKEFKNTHNGKFVSEIDYKAGELITGYFACCTNIGLGAKLAQSANSGIRRYLGDFAGTFYSLIKILASYKADDLLIHRDGESLKLTNLLNLSIGITFYIASGIKVKNDLTGDDERFYSLAAIKNSMPGTIDIVNKIYSGKKIISNKNIILDYLKKIEISGSSLNPGIEYDGDPKGFLPCIIEYAQDPIELIVPENIKGK